MSPGEAFEALSRCAADPAFFARLHSAYLGRHDVLDALYWAAHPGSTSPSGLADPALNRSRMQAGAFARGATSADELALAEFEKTLSTDAAALDSAVQRATAECDAAESDAGDRDAADSAAGDSAAAGMADYSASVDSLELSTPNLVRWRPSWALLAVLCAAIAVLASSAATITRQRVDSGNTSVLAVFDRPQTKAEASAQNILPKSDQFTVKPPDQLPDPAAISPEKSTVRFLGTSRGWKGWGFMLKGGYICFSAARSTTTSYATCGLPESFANRGLSTTIYSTDGTVTISLLISWGPNKPFTVRDVPHP